MLKLWHKGFIHHSIIHIMKIKPNVVWCAVTAPALPPPRPLRLSSVDFVCVSCGPHQGSGGSASPRRLSTHLPPSSLRVCASSVQLWLQDLTCLCFEVLASVTLSVPLPLFQLPVLSLFLLTRSKQFNQRHSVSGLLSPCVYVFFNSGEKR